jgi:hypothetical protein
MSIQQNFPAISPSLSLNFARSKTLDPRITFTRTSSATRVNGQGLIEVIPANSARFDHSYNPVSGTVRSLGLLVEEARSNLFTRSEDFGTTWFNQNSSETPSSDIAPDGTNNAWELKDTIDSVNVTHQIVESINLTSATTYTISVFIKANTLPRVLLVLSGSVSFSSGPKVGTYNLQTGQIVSNTTGTTAQIISYPNGWYRCILSVTADGTGGAFIAIRLDDGTANSYTGDGTGSILIWGAQLEAGAFPTSYIPTSGSTVTRTADNASMVGENFSSWYNSSEGSIYCSFYRSLEPSTFHYPVGVRNQSDVNNRIFIIFSTAFNGIIRGGIVKDEVVQADSFTAAVYSRTSINKSIISYEENNVTAAASGSLGGTNTTAQIPQNINQMVVGAIGPTGQLNGHISQLTYYPKRLPNAFLQNLTK